MSNKPVAIEYLLTDSVSPGLNKIEGAATSVEKTIARTSDNIKAKLREQKATVKLVEDDLKSLEVQLKKTAPGGAWLEMKAEVEACRKVLDEEKVALVAIEQEHDKAAVSGKRLSRELREMQDAMTRLRLEGKQLSPEYAEMEQKAAVLADTLGDVRAQTNVLAHDNAGLQGVISGVSGLTGAITAGVGVMGIFTKNNEDMVKVQTKVQSVLAITMGLQQMMNVLNKDSAFRLVTLRKVKDAFTAANTRLAVSLGISNVAAKALMATLTLGLSVAVGAAIALWDKYRSKQAAAKEEAEEFGKKMAEAAAKPISTIQELSATWSKLGDNLKAKEKFVEDNKSRFNELGVSVNSVTDAENLLVANKSKFIEACLARAKALAVQELAVEKYKEVLLAQQNLAATPKEYVTRRGTYTDGYGTQRRGKVDQKSDQWQEAEDAVTETERAYNALIRQQVDFSAQEREILDSIGAGAIDVIEGSVAAIERVIASKRELLKNATNREEYARIAAEIKAEEKKLSAITGSGNNASPQTQENHAKLARLQQQLAGDAAQADIDARADSLDKTLAQNKLNHEREIAQIKQFGAELLAAHKAVNKNITELPEADRAMLATMTAAADSNYATADNDARQAEADRLAGMLKEYQTYEQKMTDIARRYAKEREDVAAAGGSEENLALVGEAEQAAIEALNLQYAEKERAFRAWMNQLATQSLDELTRTLAEAERALAEAEASGGTDRELAAARSRVSQAKAAIKEESEKVTTETDADKQQKAWQKLYSTLQKISNEFEEIGDNVGGVAGDIIKTAGNIATSTLSIISGIQSFAKLSMDITVLAAQGASTAIQQVERASVILAIIGAVMKVVQAITGLFKDNEEQLRAAADAAFKYEQALKRIAITKQYDLFDTIFGIDALGKFEAAVTIAEGALESIKTQVEGIGGTPANFADYLKQFGGGAAGLMRALSEWDKANGIEATFDGRNGWNKLIGSGNHKIKTTRFNVGDFFSADGSMTSDQLEALRAWYDEFAAGLDDAEKKTIESLIATGEAYVEAVQTQKDYIQDMFGDLASNIADNMIEAFLETGDAAENLGEVVNDVAKNMAKNIVSNLIFDKVLSGLTDDVWGLIQNGDYAGAANLIKGAVDGIKTMVPELVTAMESVGLAAGDAADKATTQSGRGGAFTTMTQDEGAELKGLFTSAQMILRDITTKIDDLGPGLTEATGVLTEIRDEVKTSNKWLGKISGVVDEIKRDGLKVK